MSLAAMLVENPEIGELGINFENVAYIRICYTHSRTGRDVATVYCMYNSEGRLVCVHRAWLSGELDSLYPGEREYNAFLERWPMMEQLPERLMENGPRLVPKVNVSGLRLA